MTILSSYSKYSDKELVSLIVNERKHEALVYLVNDRYYPDVLHYAYLYYDTLDYLDDLMEELILHLMGSQGDYSKLASFRWESSFRTWISRVISNLFLNKRKLLLGFENNRVNMGEKAMEKMPAPENSDIRMVKLLEAISRLENPDFKFVLIKELEGYKPDEISRMLYIKRKQENRLTYRMGKEVIPTAAYVYNLKSDALKEVKAIMKTLKY